MLILLRHGQTTSNVDHKLDTVLPGAELTELGREQAKSAGAEILDSYEVDRVISSRATRAKQTAQIGFGERFSDIPAVDGIHEVHAGRWEMHNSREAHEAYLGAFRGFYRRQLEALIDGGDTLDIFLSRYKGGLLPYAAQEGTTVAVSHGGAIRAFAANACEIDPDFAEASYLPNCQYVVVDPTAGPTGDPAADFGRWRVVRWAEYPLPGASG
ncbi:MULTISPECIES: histidine phosphatase family protein [unclassified Corynebacterium]|uniref:histidine phosphatase family protein n=1 Tax=unclassified Corynebacterium TaxID=2624378 RepID=UPI0021AAB263|nr:MULTISPECIES: histidine phosphatase family protein [unclassified Corynebacterium]MCT1453114.1 phosphoglycerate mutase family protein [Corynebacterium sp. p3-SID1145]MCT1462225.1 phosphoglycerate mutase family protein [Corynebacterium sp. p3-SID1140]MDN8595490.1 histidine phosphatase family protein [Corynebacterium sp. P4_F2]WKK55264.1 histidine phosphatase family protein [Corynebacterium sp. P4-C1]WKK62672.1 histidine phosphatase family protein [Corynebacterium sp. P8-C1]